MKPPLLEETRRHMITLLLLDQHAGCWPLCATAGWLSGHSSCRRWKQPRTGLTAHIVAYTRNILMTICEQRLAAPTALLRAEGQT